MFVIVGERLVIFVNGRQVRVGEDIGQDFQLAALTRLQLAVGAAHPAAVPFVLVFPFFRVADAGLGFHIIEPGVFHAIAAGPHVLQVTEQVWQPMHLSRFSTMPICARIFIDLLGEGRAGAGRPAGAPHLASGVSSQSTFFILRTITNSSRLEPTVP